MKPNKFRKGTGREKEYKKKNEKSAMKAKEAKELVAKIESNFSCKLDISPEDYAFIIDSDENITLVKKDVFNFNIKAYSVGMSFASITKDGIKLSLETAQIAGKSAKKNVVEISEKNVKEWMKGSNLKLNNDIKSDTINSSENKYVIIKFNKDILGCGKITNSEIINLLPKERYIFNLI